MILVSLSHPPVSSSASPLKASPGSGVHRAALPRSESLCQGQSFPPLCPPDKPQPPPLGKREALGRKGGCRGAGAWGSCLVLQGHLGAAQWGPGFLAWGLADEGFDHPVLSHNGLGEEQQPGWSHHRGFGRVRTVIMATLQIPGLNHRVPVGPAQAQCQQD